MELLLWAILLVIIYLAYEIFVLRKEKTLENMKDGKELTLLSKRYKIDYSKVNYKKLVRTVAISNAFIISTVVSIVCLLSRIIDNIILWSLLTIVVGLVLLIPMILIIYGMIGRRYQKISKQEE